MNAKLSVRTHIDSSDYFVYVCPNESGFMQCFYKELLDEISSVHFFIDQSVELRANLYLQMVQRLGITVHSHVKVVDEGLKSLERLQEFYLDLFHGGADRKSLVIIVGGGVLTDALGFVASTYMRGLAYCSIPTSLLSQVDSCLGGKTGVNIPDGKNLVGTFANPKSVYVDISFLNTLPVREIVSGFGEIIKYAFLVGGDFFEMVAQLIRKQKPICENTDEWRTIVQRCLEYKRDIVSEDPFEKTGKRALLNFGHTIAHALESLTHYSYFRHGEAVIWGMRAAVHISYSLKVLDESEYARAQDICDAVPIISIPPHILIAPIVASLKKDKKSIGGSNTFILMKKIGDLEITKDISDKIIVNALKYIGVKEE